MALHAGLLGVRFADPERFNKVFKDTPLEVILVNARASEKPQKAQAIAQFSLAGGGQLDKGRATSPLPPSALTLTGDAAEDAQRSIDAMQEQQMQLLAQVRKEVAKLSAPDPQVPANRQAQLAREEKRRQLVKVLGEIEKRVNEENARPKKRFISPSTMAGVHAIYATRFKETVEKLGTQNFPSVAGRKLYGELIMLISLDAKGQVIQTEIVTSSGNKTLDRLAQTIVRAGAPYGRFTPEMLREFQVLVTSSRFRFTRDETLETQVLGR